MTANLRTPQDWRIYFLADHLDSILACGEDLNSFCFSSKKESKGPYNKSCVVRLKQFVSKIRKIEFQILGHIKLAQSYSKALSKSNLKLARFARLFASSTSVAIVSINEIYDLDYHAFRDGSDPLVYLRTRGVITNSTGCLKFAAQLSVSDNLMIAGRFELGVLLDLCAEFLDLLDETFDLFESRPTVKTEKHALVLASQSQTKPPFSISSLRNLYLGN
ncbi:MAG TPA: hypothetical protein TECP_00763 [Hyphomicrobiaceae bacterium MAG_BT-2024]